MQCSKSAEWMSLQLDGLLSEEQAEQLQSHLIHCPSCRDQWEAVSWVSSMLEAQPVVIPSTDFTSKVMTRLHERDVRRRRLYGGLRLCVGSVGLWAVVTTALSLAVLWRSPIGVVLWDIGVPLADNLLAVLTVLGKALWYATYTLVTRPAAILILGYALLAAALTMGWMRVLRQRWERAPQ